MDTIVTPPSAIHARPTSILLVRIRDLHLTVPSAAGPVNILRGIDLDIASGEAVGIVGPSGSGKTSLLMVLAGLERATSGSVALGGREITGLDEDALARLRREQVGIVFQAFHLIPTMTALENVSVPLELAGVRDAGARAREPGAVGLGHRLTHLPGQLSGGEQQRVALARAFAPEPALLLADEPTGNLDHATGEAVMDLLFALRQRTGTTLLLITHDRDLAPAATADPHGRWIGRAAAIGAALAGSTPAGRCDRWRCPARAAGAARRRARPVDRAACASPSASRVIAAVGTLREGGSRADWRRTAAAAGRRPRGRGRLAAAARRAARLAARRAAPASPTWRRCVPCWSRRPASGSWSN